MTKEDFHKKLEAMYKEHSFIIAKPKITFNELVWVLRQDNVDYNISIPPYKEDMGWMCIPSVKECFIPVKQLAMHVNVVELDEDEEYDGICLTVYLEN